MKLPTEIGLEQVEAWADDPFFKRLPECTQMALVTLAAEHACLVENRDRKYSEWRLYVKKIWEIPDGGTRRDSRRYPDDDERRIAKDKEFDYMKADMALSDKNKAIDELAALAIETEAAVVKGKSDRMAKLLGTIAMRVFERMRPKGWQKPPIEMEREYRERMANDATE